MSYNGIVWIRMYALFQLNYTDRVHSSDICLHGYCVMWINMHLKNMSKPLYAIRTTEIDNGA